jgi:hypothetical protein
MNTNGEKSWKLEAGSWKLEAGSWRLERRNRIIRKKALQSF